VSTTLGMLHPASSWIVGQVVGGAGGVSRLGAM
jgi:hypothetical protein